MKPIGATVLARVEEIRQETNGLETPNQNYVTGIVEAVGPGTPTYPKMVCKPNDRIRWYRNKGDKFKYNGDNYILLNEEKQEIPIIL